MFAFANSALAVLSKSRIVVVVEEESVLTLEDNASAPTKFLSGAVVFDVQVLATLLSTATVFVVPASLGAGIVRVVVVFDTTFGVTRSGAIIERFSASNVEVRPSEVGTVSQFVLMFFKLSCTIFELVVADDEKLLFVELVVETIF